VILGREDAVAISFNGGKDCTVLLHLLAVALWHRRKLATAVSLVADGDSPGSSAPSQAVAPPEESTAMAVEAPSSSSILIPSSTPKPFKALYVTCSSPFSQVDAFVLQCAQSYHLDLFETHPGGLPMKEALRQYQEKEPSVKSILIGTRRADPHGGNLDLRTPTDDGWPRYQRVHPILNWTYGEIWEYLKRFDIPYCDLYNEGYTSLGSTFDTFPNPALRDANGRYKPAYELKDGSKERYGRARIGPSTPAL